MTVKLTVARLLLFLISVATLVVLLAAFLSAGEPPERAERGKDHSVPEDAEVAREQQELCRLRRQEPDRRRQRAARRLRR